jgi:hypothetical protein
MSDNHKPVATVTCECGYVSDKLWSPRLATYARYRSECQKRSVRKIERNGRGGVRNLAHKYPDEPAIIGSKAGVQATPAQMLAALQFCFVEPQA